MARIAENERENICPEFDDTQFYMTEDEFCGFLHAAIQPELDAFGKKAPAIWERISEKIKALDNGENGADHAD